MLFSFGTMSIRMMWLAVISSSLGSWGSVQGLEGRSDDAPALESVVHGLAASLNALQAKVNSQETLIQQLQGRAQQLEAQNAKRVAFSAFISDNEQISHNMGTVVPFRSVITNVGNAFNPSTSSFTCPIDGDYVFLLNMNARQFGDWDYFELHKNGHLVTLADRDDTTSTLFTTSTVMSLRVGDVVNVVQHAAAGSLDVGEDCTFTGFLLR